MPRLHFLNILFSVALLGVSWGCQAVPESGSELKNSQLAFAGDQLDVPKTKDIKSDDLSIRQVEAAIDDEAAGRKYLLTVEQLDQGISKGFSFEAVEGDHPCEDAQQDDEQCAAASKAISAAAEGDAIRKKGRRSAEAELQSLTSDIIDPDSFDPVRTIDEIGRGGQLNSLSARAVGSRFLSGDGLLSLQEEDLAPDALSGLPPVVLDITVTQGDVPES